MPYKNDQELPDKVRNVLPAHGQHIYREAFNHAWEEYKEEKQRSKEDSREAVAHAVAWSAVKKKYTKDEDTGHWKLK
jgi:cation transport regulator